MQLQIVQAFLMLRFAAMIFLAPIFSRETTDLP